jgi:hypothetical protein
MTVRAQRAIVRRLVLIAGTLVGIIFAFWPRPVLYRIGITDFAQRQRGEYGWTNRREMELADYIKDRTEGRLLRVEGQAWQDLYKDVAALGEQGYFLPDQRPLDDIAHHFDGSFTYVALEQGSTAVYLDVTLVRPGDFPKAPASLQYPLRRFALGVFLAALLGYLLIPWPKPDPDVVAYARFTGTLLPDLGVGVVLVGLFFALPWFIVPHQAHVSHPLVLDGGWIILTVIMWGMSLFGLAIHAVAAWYEAWCIHIGADHLIMESIWGVERVPFADIEKLTMGSREPPRALIIAGLLISLLNWRAAGPTLLAAGRKDPVACLVTRDGRRRTFGATALCNADRLVASLQQAGVAVDPDLLS